MDAAAELRLMQLFRESPLTADAAAIRCNVRPATFNSWVTRGKLVNGMRVKVTAYKTGRSWMTSLEELVRFSADLDAARRGLPPPPAPHTAREVAACRAEGRAMLERGRG